MKFLQLGLNHKGGSMLWSRKIHLNESLENIYNDVCFEETQLDNGEWICTDFKVIFKYNLLIFFI
ncbi:hypothetical protein FLZ95_06560 [Campylobacter upsaliensis]|uniref:Uncharacterized protein n=2 Tax=Campylobacter upsaliensis TaxID=28080 RepID=A0A5M1DZG9_CAMUP|nr:hypothetical protein [Campylobacter upsaliensis]EAI9132131.1 hypothetical protein [Campylobacter upsaliensis]EAJ7019366.1 hypothetical protein [Campylobacter upsaliensis]ECB9743389.1 hypothetical protein [Campylobacter upsaliensis]